MNRPNTDKMASREYNEYKWYEPERRLGDEAIDILVRILKHPKRDMPPEEELEDEEDVVY